MDTLCKLQSFMVYSSNMFHTEVENSVAVDKIQSKKVSSVEIEKKNSRRKFTSAAV